MIAAFGDAGSLRGAYEQVDWAATAVGPPDSWSPTLRASLSITLNTRFPVTLLWGPRYVLLYNEAYVELIAGKHPAALGRPAEEVFPEIWDVIGPLLDSVRRGDGSVLMQDLRLDLHRNGFLEECYFTFAYSAVRGAGNAIEGVIDITEEATPRIVTRRRIEALGRLAQALAVLEDLDHLADKVAAALRPAASDLSQVRLHRLHDHDGVAREDLTIAQTADGPLVRIPLASLADPPVEFLLTARLNDALVVDEAYRTFLRLVGSTTAEAIARVAAHQAERRAAALERRMSEALQLSLLTPPVEDDRVQIAVRYRPAAEQAHVGGDWYDSFVLPGGCLTVAIGDVSGHDRRAAADMAQIRNLLRGIAFTVQSPPSAILSALDRAMATLGPSTLATVLLAQLTLPPRPAGGHLLRWSNAGHPPPVLLLPTGQARLLTPPPEPLLGFLSTTTRADHTVELPPGSSLVLFTDGLIERREAERSAAPECLLDVVAQRQQLSADELCDEILKHFGDDLEDDVALTIVRTV
ncbi:PP2C family protein-serine/threonine phosphatase [Catellatospora sp. KI3]|uniref:PP2C family protein-serine/threonine phosphatase n=1 Tax=Catellatospora sp. KI3 TaxID=3041620 RepID=UPI0024830D17|nr:PP2C family protein-serine/threonine phosphatase [Catellatospora sp. KI3]MDI1461185.1 PP2C family protein-serine/threonine phosphatase [Catellatospora sp. KI3]